MQAAKLFGNGRSQAVRLPEDCRFPGDEVSVRKCRDVVILLPKESLRAPLANSLDMVAYDGPAAVAYGRVRAELERVGTSIGPLNTRIAAHAPSLGEAAAIDHQGGFCRVPGRRVENWTR